MARQFRISPGRWLFLALLGAGIIALGWLGTRGAASAPSSDASAASSGAGELQAGRQIYDADVALAQMPEPLIGGLILLTPEQVVRTPLIDGFEWPCGTTQGAMAYDAQPFGTPNEKRGGLHTGMDLNGIGGQNTDLGMPVRAAARGLVVYCGTPSPSWGKVVVLAHRLPDSGRVIQTLYAHLEETDSRVIPGQTVSRGDRIGAMGTVDGQYLAHLHFEAVESRCTEAGMPGYSAQGTMNRLDPAALLRDYPAPPFPDAYSELRRLRYREAAHMSSADAAAPTDRSSDGRGGIPEQEDVIRVSPADFF